MQKKPSENVKAEWLDDEDDVPFGDPPRMYNYKCKNCGFMSDINEAHIDVAYAWTKKRTTCQDGEVVPVLECPDCGKIAFVCAD